MQLLLIARIFLQQIFLGKSDIQQQFTLIVSHRDKLQVCSLESHSKHNWHSKLIPLHELVSLDIEHRVTKLSQPLWPTFF